MLLTDGRPASLFTAAGSAELAANYAVHDAGNWLDTGTVLPQGMVFLAPPDVVHATTPGAIWLGGGGRSAPASIEDTDITVSSGVFATGRQVMLSY